MRSSRQLFQRGPDFILEKGRRTHFSLGQTMLRPSSPPNLRAGPSAMSCRFYGPEETKNEVEGEYVLELGGIGGGLALLFLEWRHIISNFVSVAGPVIQGFQR